MKRLLAIALLVAACSGSSGGAASIPPSGLGLVGPSSGSATEEPLATENLASDNPASDPPAAPALAVKVTKAPGSVAQGGTATVTISTTKGSSCDIDVVYYSGSSDAKGLETKTADSKGVVTWKWMVGRKTTKGKWPVTISCALGDRTGDAETSVTVE